MVLAIAWQLRTASVPRLTGTRGAAALVHHFTLCLHRAGGWPSRRRLPVGLRSCPEPRPLASCVSPPPPAWALRDTGRAGIPAAPSQPARARLGVGAGIVPRGGLSGEAAL